MNVNPPLSLKEEYGRSRKRSRKSSTSGSAILVYEDACLGDPFFIRCLGLTAILSTRVFLIQFALGTIVVAVPKTWDFYDRFYNHATRTFSVDCSRALGVVEHFALDVCGSQLSFAVRPRIPPSV